MVFDMHHTAQHVVKGAQELHLDGYNNEQVSQHRNMVTSKTRLPCVVRVEALTSFDCFEGNYTCNL